MECLRGQTASERRGTLWCYEKGCKQRPGSPLKDEETRGDPSTFDCILQLQLRAGDPERDLSGDFGGTELLHVEYDINDLGIDEEALRNHQLWFGDTRFKWDPIDRVFRPTSLGHESRGVGVGPTGHDETHIIRGSE